MSPHPVPTAERRIAICVATWRRPHLLAGLLDALEQQRLPPGYVAEIRVVDNDALGSASEVVRERLGSRIAIRYRIEPERSIARARNGAVDLDPRAELYAFIDDDEVPAPGWLSGLVDALGEGFDAAFGEVHAQLPASAPGWVRRGAFHDKRFPPGLGARHWPGARTSNALVRGTWFAQGLRFREAFGRTGGEDSDLFRRMVERGARFAWTGRAPVTEIVHDEQSTFRWLWRRHVRNGRNFQRLRVGEPAVGRAIARLGAAGLHIAAALPSVCVGRLERLAAAALRVGRAFGGLAEAFQRQPHSPSGYASAGVRPAPDHDEARPCASRS